MTVVEVSMTRHEFAIQGLGQGASEMYRAVCMTCDCDWASVKYFNAGSAITAGTLHEQDCTRLQIRIAT